MATRRKIERDRKILARDKFTCQYCGWVGDTFEKWRYLVVDHFKPRAKGGHFDAEENLITACIDCNLIKKDEVFATLAEAKAKFEALYLPKERRDFEEHFASMVGRALGRHG